uniref:LysR family transcriptional regulator substrate-binding protein n=1 Tax=Candidatus Rhodobacter oscarellae TaxID=1675527 RepID=UPI00373FC829
MLTPVGQEIFELADDFAALDQRIEERLRGHTDVERGQLTIIANAPQPALSLIARYTGTYPLVSVDFRLLDWAAAMEMVTSKQADIAIITDPSDQRDLFVRPITRTRYVCYMRQDHCLAHRAEISLNQIASHTLLLPERGSLTRRVVTKALAKARLTPRRIVTMTTFPVMKEAILQGIGLGIFLEASSVADSQLSELPITEMQQTLTTSVVIPKHKVGLRITQSFLGVVEGTINAWRVHESSVTCVAPQSRTLTLAELSGSPSRNWPHEFCGWTPLKIGGLPCRHRIETRATL